MIHFTKRICLFVVCLSIFFVSCKDDDETSNIQPVKIEIEGAPSTDKVTLPQEESLTLKAKVTGSSEYKILWELDGKKVSEAVEYTLVATTLGEHNLTLTITTTDGTTSKSNLKFTVEGKYKRGTIVLNEGNMSDGNGSIIFISPKNVMTEKAYFGANSSSIGNVTQDLFIANNKMYLISQNGSKSGGDGILVIVHAETFKKEVVYNEELKALRTPSHIAVVGANKVYIRHGQGISLFNTDTKELKFIPATEGAAKNRMAVVGDKVFAASGKKIMVIQGEKVTATFDMPGAISGVIRSYDNNLWVSCTSTPAKICKVNAKDYSLIQANELGDKKIEAGWGASPAISAKSDTLYFCNNSTNIYRHVFTSKQTDLMIDVKAQVVNAGMIYNNPAVHPETGEVYFNTIKGWGQDYLINDISVWNFSNKEHPTMTQDYRNHTQFPAGVFFTANFLN